MATEIVDAVEVVELNAEQGRSMLNSQTLDKLGISSSEFLERLDAGEYIGTEDEEVLRLVMFAPFGR